MPPHGSHKDELSFYLTEGSLSEPQPKPKSPLISPILSPYGSEQSFGFPFVLVWPADSPGRGLRGLGLEP